MIGDVRGPGLFIGVDLVVDRETREPATEACQEALDHALDIGLLTYFGGAGNVLKFKPPAVTSDEDIDTMLDRCEDVIAFVQRGSRRAGHRRAAGSAGGRHLMSAENEGVSSRERRDTIMETLPEQDSVSVRDLAERFSVSAMTIHRDLDALETIGVLRKVRGGATAQPTALYESSLGFRLAQMPAAKRRIAEEAAKRVKPGASVALDDSTTTLAMLPFLAESGS